MSSCASCGRAVSGISPDVKVCTVEAVMCLDCGRRRLGPAAFLPVARLFETWARNGDLDALWRWRRVARPFLCDEP
jgi:hypothetical protein